MSVDDLVRQGLVASVAGLDVDVDAGLAAVGDRAARRRRTRAAVGVTLGAVLLVGAVGVGGLLGRPDRVDPAGSGPLSLSVLDRRQAAPPAWSTFVEAPMAHPGQASRLARLAPVDPSGGVWLEAWLAQTTDDRLCVVILEQGLTYASGSSNGCQPSSQLLTGGVYLTWVDPGSPDGPNQLVLVVPDGYTTATAGGVTVPVAANAALLGPLGDGTITLAGPDLADRTIDLDRDFVAIYGGAVEDSQEARARLVLRGVAQAAQQYQLEHADSSGFVAHLREQDGQAVIDQLAELSETGATAVLDDGRCLSVDFPGDAITEGPC